MREPFSPLGESVVSRNLQLLASGRFARSCRLPDLESSDAATFSTLEKLTKKVTLTTCYSLQTAILQGVGFFIDAAKHPVKRTTLPAAVLPGCSPLPSSNRAVARRLE
jgi:hypothetical protein